jgi:CheY-like chemotaxis protein
MDAQAVIIDDNPKNVNVLARLLSNEGLSSVQITNPANLAVALKHAENIKVIFVDLEMPGTNGYQILNQLKADVRFQSVPVLAYTVHVSEINVAHERGFDGFLGKPLDADNFPGQLARILSGEAVWETP